MYGGNGGHTAQQVMNGAPPSINNGWLVSIDPTTGVVTPLGQPAGVTRLSGLAFAPGGVLYASSINGNNSFPPTGSAAQTSDVLQINPINGSLISDHPITFNGTNIEIADLAVQPGTGVLYAISAGANTSAPGFLYTINPQTGLATFVANTGDFFGGLAFAPNGTLYLLSADLDMNGNIVNQELKTLNPVSGQTLTSIALPSSDPLGIFGAFGINPLTGALIAGDGDLGDFYTIDPTTGDATFLFNTSPNFVGDIDFQTVPEPLASGIFILGLFGVAAYSRYRR
jgi:hypothetical protein